LTIVREVMTIKILCMNVHKGHDWLGRKKSLHFLDNNIKKLQPDLIFFQEILGKDADYLVLDNWPHYSYGKNVIHATHHYGNAILSKFPIVFSENFNLSTHRFEQRGLLHSTILLPNQHHMHLLCVHLGLFRRGRGKQLKIIVDHIEKHIPQNEPIILAGDFNDWSSEATRPLIKGLVLHEAFLTHQGNYAKTFPSWSPLLMLDRIYFRGFNVTHAERLIEKSWRKISDHIGIYAVLE
jgi:endonuclease/exonuclease/phosphatase family metal-dependent hydrolase